jgi:AcrR family transcriptional regulator
MTMGRPREFNVEHALDKALNVFWRNGYEGTSIADLTDAMGINPPSLYAAFGNKEKLFHKALERYAQQVTSYWNEAIEKPTARGMAEHLLRKSADFLSEECNPPGCMMVRTAMQCSAAEESIERELASRRATGEVMLRERLATAKDQGELPADLDPQDYARYLMTVLEGMSVRSANGSSREELHKIADMALRTWPS